MHDSMQYDPIQGQDHEPLKVGNPAVILKLAETSLAKSWLLVPYRANLFYLVMMACFVELLQIGPGLQKADYRNLWHKFYRSDAQ